MNTGLYRIEWTGLPGWGDWLSRRPAAMIGYSKIRLIGLAIVLVTVCGAGMLWPGKFGAGAEDEPVILAAATQSEPVVISAAVAAQEMAVPNPEAAPEAAASLDGLRISSQRWRRGGLGSKALVTFTLRNRNDYAVRDIEIFCAFSRGDGSHLTDRTRVIHDTVRMRGRKTFARVHVGFVNINADRAKCALVAASRV